MRVVPIVHLFFRWGIGEFGVVLQRSGKPCRARFWHTDAAQEHRAGVKAPDFVQKMDAFETSRGGQIIVKPTLQSTVDDDVYVIGDCCACEQPDGNWVPPRAQSAHQMASLVYRNIQLVEQGKPLKSYIYKDHGSLVNLSKYSTVGSLMGNLTKGSMFIEGRIARVVYISLYRMHQIAIHGWIRASAVMLAQKISNAVKPKMKLH